MRPRAIQHSISDQLGFQVDLPANHLAGLAETRVEPRRATMTARDKMPTNLPRSPQTAEKPPENNTRPFGSARAYRQTSPPFAELLKKRGRR
jgi:hypothetical protein